MIKLISKMPLETQVSRVKGIRALQTLLVGCNTSNSLRSPYGKI